LRLLAVFRTFAENNTFT